ncbi:MAG: hypothetical protein AMXMBFR82_23630 [Candidatus Hydrogenedentota bacterium]
MSYRAPKSRIPILRFATASAVALAALAGIFLGDPAARRALADVYLLSGSADASRAWRNPVETERRITSTEFRFRGMTWDAQTQFLDCSPAEAIDRLDERYGGLPPSDAAAPAAASMEHFEAMATTSIPFHSYNVGAHTVVRTYADLAYPEPRRILMAIARETRQGCVLTTLRLQSRKSFWNMAVPSEERALDTAVGHQVVLHPEARVVESVEHISSGDSFTTYLVEHLAATPDVVSFYGTAYSGIQTARPLGEDGPVVQEWEGDGLRARFFHVPRETDPETTSLLKIQQVSQSASTMESVKR